MSTEPFSSPTVTRDTITRADILELEDRARAAGDRDLAEYIGRALDQRYAWRRGLECDTDILDFCVQEINEHNAAIDAAFARAAQTVDSFTGRKDWRAAVLGEI